MTEENIRVNIKEELEAAGKIFLESELLFKNGFFKGAVSRLYYSLLYYIRALLLTKGLEKAFAKIGRQESVDDPVAVAHFFNPCGAGDWWATEFDPETREFFGYVSIFGDHCDEWGYFSLDELESVKGPFGVGIERDLHWTPRPISEVCAKTKMG